MSQNLTMRRGRTFTFDLTVTRAGAEFDLTGCTLRVTAKWAFTDADASAVFTRTSPSTGIVITNATAGLATVTIPPASTSSLPANEVNLVYDVQLTDASSNVWTLVDGLLTVLPNVSLTTP